MRRELPEFIGTRIAPLVERRMGEAANRIAELVAIGLFDERLEPILRRFRQEGGSVADLKSRIAEDAAAFRSPLEAIVTTQLARVLSGVAADTTELMQDWYRHHRLAIDQRLTGAGTPVDMAADLQLADPDVYGEITGVVLALSTTLVTVLVAAISGGAGTAIVMSGPLGLLTGALIGLIAGALAMRYGTDEAKRRAEQWEGAPVWLLARALSDTKIARLRDDLKGQVADKVNAQSAQARQGLEDQIGERVAQDIASLSAINQPW